MRDRKGFTLIELLVVISIISLLSSIILSSLNAARTKARDAKRKEDFHQIQQALALYYDEYGVYPPVKPNTACGGTDVWADSIGTCGGQWLTTDANFYKFMPSVPVDPKNSGGNASGGDGNNVYSYYPSYNIRSQDYDLMTQLENPSDSARCASRQYLNHNNANPANPIPWCPPWPNNANRSQNIYEDH